MLVPGEKMKDGCYRLWSMADRLAETADDILLEAGMEDRVDKKELTKLLMAASRFQSYAYDFYTRAFDEVPDISSRPGIENGDAQLQDDGAEATCVFELPGIIRCSTNVLPYLKNNSSQYILSGILAEKFGNAVSETVGAMDRWPAPVTYIFVNRLLPGTSGKQPYYDNDNILLKRYLDEIAPLIGGDDNCSSCNTLYTWQEDPVSGFDIYAVRDGWLPEWASLHSSTCLGGQLAGFLH